MIVFQFQFQSNITLIDFTSAIGYINWVLTKFLRFSNYIKIFSWFRNTLIFDNVFHCLFLLFNIQIFILVVDRFYILVAWIQIQFIFQNIKLIWTVKFILYVLPYIRFLKISIRRQNWIDRNLRLGRNSSRDFSIDPRHKFYILMFWWDLFMQKLLFIWVQYLILNRYFSVKFLGHIKLFTTFAWVLELILISETVYLDAKDIRDLSDILHLYSINIDFLIIIFWIKKTIFK